MNYFKILENASVTNKYYIWYIKICQTAEKRALPSDQYKEKHHIVPKSLNLGGTKDARNLVLLTAREHYLVHRLLPKFLKDETHKKKMKYAFWYLSTRNINYIPSSRTYEVARKELIRCIKERNDSYETRCKKARPGKLNGMYGKTHSPEVKEKLSRLRTEQLTGKTYEELYGEEKALLLKEDRSAKLKAYISNNPTARQGKNNANAKTFELTDPEGKVYQVTGNIKSFCKDHGLSVYYIINVAKKRKMSYNGWTARYI
jgi:hypothetical protein